MRLSSGPGSEPESHTPSRPDAAPRSTLRSLCSPATLTGGLTELAWVGAHALLYSLGAGREAPRPDPPQRPGGEPPPSRAPLAAAPPAAPSPGPLGHGFGCK